MERDSTEVWFITSLTQFWWYNCPSVFCQNENHKKERLKCAQGMCERFRRNLHSLDSLEGSMKVLPSARDKSSQDIQPLASQQDLTLSLQMEALFHLSSGSQVLGNKKAAFNWTYFPFFPSMHQSPPSSS